MHTFRAIRVARLAVHTPAPILTRHYAPDVRPEGTTGSSKGFGQREQAEEGQYIKKMEAEKLKTAQEKLEAAKAELEELEKKKSIESK